MEVNQNFIKINQTTQSDGGKAKSITKPSTNVNSFDQILAMFHFLSQAPDSDTNTSVPSDKNSDNTESNRIDSTNPSTENEGQIEPILLGLLAASNQVPSLFTSESAPISGSLLNGLKTPTGSQMVSPLQQQQLEAVFNQLSAFDKSQVEQKISQLIRDIQVQDGQKSLGGSILPVSNFVPEVSKWISGFMSNLAGQPGSAEAEISMKPDNLGKTAIKITSQDSQISVQILTGSSVAKQEIEGQLQLLKQSLQQNGLVANKIDVAVNLSGNGTAVNESQHQAVFPNMVNLIQPNDKRIVSLDKNQVISSKPDLEQSSTLGSLVLPNHQQVNTDGSNPVKAGQATTSLSVSDFVPEMSEWIGRYMRISGGQAGSTEAKFSLNPEHLGPIEIKIVSDQGQVSAQIVTDTSMAKDALEGQLQHLRQALQEHGIIVQKLDIVQQSSQSMDSNPSSFSFSQGGSGSSSEQKRYASVQDSSKKQKDGEQKDLEKEIPMITYGGSSLRTASSIDFTA